MSNTETCFRYLVYEGADEWFDLSRKPIERDSFSFGGVPERQEGYYITDACIGCGNCASVCPAGAVERR